MTIALMHASGWVVDRSLVPVELRLPERLDGGHCGRVAYAEFAEFEAGAQRAELLVEVLVAAVDQRDAVHRRRPLRGEGCDEVREAGAQVGDLEFGGVQF